MTSELLSFDGENWKDSRLVFEAYTPPVGDFPARFDPSHPLDVL